MASLPYSKSFKISRENNKDQTTFEGVEIMLKIGVKAKPQIFVLEIRFHPKEGRFEARLTRAERPSAAGARRFEGRFAITATHVFAGVTLPAGSGETPGTFAPDSITSPLR